MNCQNLHRFTIYIGVAEAQKHDKCTWTKSGIQKTQLLPRITGIIHLQSFTVVIQLYMPRDGRIKLKPLDHALVMPMSVKNVSM